MRIDVTLELKSAIEKIQSGTDGWPWYWIAEGEKCYCFSCVEAYPENEGDPFPRPGSLLEWKYDGKDDGLYGENGTKMMTGEYIVGIERQNGAAICRFIAEAHAALCNPRTEDSDG